MRSILLINLVSPNDSSGKTLVYEYENGKILFGLSEQGVSLIEIDIFDQLDMAIKFPINIYDFTLGKTTISDILKHYDGENEDIRCTEITDVDVGMSNREIFFYMSGCSDSTYEPHLYSFAHYGGKLFLSQEGSTIDTINTDLAKVKLVHSISYYHPYYEDFE